MLLWGRDVAPSLFPYMILCQSLMSELSRSSFPSALMVPLLGLVGGSPSGSAAIAMSAYAKPLSKKRLLTLCALCGTIGPMFFLGPISLWLKSEEMGVILLIVHFVGAAGAALLVFPFSSRNECRMIPPQDASAAETPIERSIRSILHVGGCIVYYSVLASILRIAFPSLPTWLSGIIQAFFEISGGIKAIALTEIPISVKLILCSGLTGFGGISILMQNAYFLRPLGVTLRQLLVFSLLRACISALAIAAVLLI